MQNVTLHRLPCRALAAPPPLAQAVAATTTVAVQANETDKQLRQFLLSCGQVRLGGDAFAYAGVAAGYNHLALDYLMQPYDYLPLIPLIAAADGCISDWQGGMLAPFDFQTHPRQVLATAGAALHKEATAVLAASANS